MVTIKTTKEIRLEDFTGVLLVEEIGSYLDYKWALVEEQKKEYDKIFDWIYKNNTIPLKGTIHIASLDGGWVNGLKLGDRLRQLKKVLFGDE